MSGYIMLDGGRTLPMYRAMIAPSTICALACCYSSLILSLAVVKIGRIVIFIKARNSLEWAVRVGRVGTISVILALRGLGWMV